MMSQSLDQPIHDAVVANRFVDELEVGMIDQVGNVVQAAGRQIVDDDDVLALRQQRLGQMTADEARAAGNE